MATNIVYGVEKVRLAPAILTEAAVASATWTQLENIAPDSIVYTKGVDTKTDLIPEDKDVAVMSFYATGDPDQIVIGVIEQKPEIMNMLFNNIYTAATSKTVTLASRKVANLAIEITTRNARDNRKQVIVLPNVQVVTTYANNLSKTAAQQLVLTGAVGSFKTTTGNLDAISIKTWVTADTNAVIDSTAG